MSFKNRSRTALCFLTLCVASAALAGGLSHWMPTGGSNALTALQFVREAAFGFALITAGVFAFLAIVALLVNVPKLAILPFWYRAIPFVGLATGIVFIGVTFEILHRGISRLNEFPGLVLFLLISIAFFGACIVGWFFAPIMICRRRTKRGHCGLCNYPLEEGVALRLAQQSASTTIQCPEDGAWHERRCP